MVLSRVLRVGALALCAAPVLVGCASVSYRTEPLVSHSRFTTIENFSTDAITPEQVDGLLAEVAQILKVRLDPTKPKARVIVTTPGRIADLYRATSVVAAHGANAEGLYFPGASLVLVPYFYRTILGHELAHYLTDHYLKQTPRDDWERIAALVERKLPSAPAAVAPTVVTAANHAPAAPAASE